MKDTKSHEFSSSWQPPRRGRSSLVAAKRRKIRGFWCLSRPRVSFFIWTLGFPSPPFRVPPKRAYRPRPNSDWADLGLKIFVWKIVTTFSLIWFPLDAIFEGQTDNLRKKFSDRFQESPNLTPTRFPFVFLIIPTQQIGKQEDFALWQLLVGYSNKCHNMI